MTAQNIKLVAADMDGTLIKNNQELTPRTAAAVRKIQARGIRFILNTGRSNSESELYYDKLKMDCSIFANGTYILDLPVQQAHRPRCRPPHIRNLCPVRLPYLHSGRPLGIYDRRGAGDMASLNKKQEDSYEGSGKKMD